jgi:hypothetical protein
LEGCQRIRKNFGKEVTLARFSDISKIRQSFKTHVPWVYSIQDIYLLIAIIMSFSLAIVAGRGFLQYDGYLYLAETFEVYNLDQFQDVFYPIWNEKTQRFILADLPKLYIVMPIIALTKAVNAVTGIDGYKTLQAILILSPFIISFLSAFKLTHYIVSKFSSDSFRQFLSAILGAFVFTINPWFATNPRDYMFRLDYAVLPLFVYLFLKMIHSGDRKYIVLLAAAISIFAAYRLALITSLVFLAILILDILICRRERILAKVSSVGILIGLVFLFSAAKFLPGIIYSGSLGSEESIIEFSTNMIQRENILDIMATKIQGWTAVAFELTYSDSFHLLFILITLFGFLYPLILYKKYKLSKEQYVLLALPVILYIPFILLSAEELNLDPLITDESNPFSQEIGRLLRHSRWNIMPALVGIAIMTALSSTKMFSIFKRSYAYALLASFLLVTASISAWPIFSGDMNGYWRPAPPPKDYMDLNQILQESGDAHHIVWFPQYSSAQRALWSNSQGISDNLPPTGLFPVRSSSPPSYRANQFYFFDYYSPIRGATGLGFTPPIYEGNLTKAYSPLNIHYLAITYDTVWPYSRELNAVYNDYLQRTANEFDNNGSANTLFEGNYLTGFELNNNAEELYSTRPILLLDRLSTYGELLPFIDKRSSVIFGSSQEAIERGVELSDNLVLRDSRDLLVLAKNKVVLEPSKFANTTNPNHGWSLASSPHDVRLFNNVENSRLSWSWPFDYGYGLAYTSAPNATLKLETNIPQTGNYQVFLRYLENDAGGLIKVNIDEREATISTFREYGSNLKWFNLGSHGFSTGKKEITLENISGLNLVNVIMMIPSDIHEIYDYIETAVTNKQLIYFYDAEHDFYELNKRGAQGLKLNLLKEADYSLTLRGQGNFSFSIADKNGNIKQIDQLQSETMNYNHSTSSVHLAPGEYELSITSTEGSHLDQAWLYTSRQPIDQLLNSASPEGQVISYDKITPTSYEVKVKSDAPFLLAFAEGYDRFWTARLRSSDDSRQFSSLPLYDVINGFWIDKTGEFTLLIEYEPQQWFNISIIISATTFVCAILYLVYRHLKLREWFNIFLHR